LSDLNPVKNLSYNYVLSGFQGEQPIVLKLGHDTKGLNVEATALKAFKGHGVVDVIDQADGALLIERAIPGHSLKEFFPNREDEATAITIEVIKKLHSAPRINQKGFPTIKDWLTALDKPCDQLGLSLIKARTLRDELLNTTDAPILLHGDLHHDNILPHNNNWKVIDPKGVIGELSYEVGCFIRNPLDDLPNDPDSLKIITNRINTFSKNLNLDSDRIAKWCFVQTVLSAVWMIEDNFDPERIIETLSYFDLLLNHSE
jgi:streptomycin 6-kinase